MTVSDRVKALEDQLAAARAEDALAVDLLAAKQAHADSPSEATYQAKRDAAEALRAHRADIRTEGVTVAGDAFIDEEV